MITNSSECLVDREVERQFRENPLVDGQLCTNPITGVHYVGDDDPIGPQKEAARRALFAREWFAVYGPADAQPLPVSYSEREENEHPYFADYVSGVLWEAERGDIGTLPYPNELADLKMRFPPHPLKGLRAGFCWEPPCTIAPPAKAGRRNCVRSDGEGRNGVAN